MYKHQDTIEHFVQIRLTLTVLEEQIRGMVTHSKAQGSNISFEEIKLLYSSVDQLRNDLNTVQSWVLESLEAVEPQSKGYVDQD